MPVPSLQDKNGDPISNTGAPEVTKGPSDWPAQYQWKRNANTPIEFFGFVSATGDPEVPTYKHKNVPTTR